MNSLNRMVDEFCENGNLFEYKDVISEIFNEIKKSGCHISARYDTDPRSSHSVRLDDNSCRIRISLKKNVYSNKLHILWTILHEFGHHFDPIDKKDQENLELRIESEEKAWNWAEEKFDTIEALTNEKKSFLECKKSYMNSYYKMRH